jgi:hypothetical protein
VSAGSTDDQRSPRSRRLLHRLPRRRAHLTTGFPQLRTPLALALSLLALLALATVAEGRRAACTAHARRGARACSAHHRRTRSGRADKRHHRRHRAARTRTAAGTAPASLAGGSPVSCEDGSAARARPDGTLSCADRSESTCEDGSKPARSGGGHALLCPFPEHESDAGEESCEDETGSPCAGAPGGSAAVTATPCPPALALAGEGAAGRCDDATSPTAQTAGGASSQLASGS